MNEVFVRIQGLVSQSSMKKIYEKLRIKEPSGNELLIFLDYSYFDVPIGFNFSYLLEASNTKVVFPLNKGEIKYVTQQWGLPFADGIPSGHTTICSIEFDPQSVNLLRSKIPIVDTWQGLNKSFLLSNVSNENWRKYYSPSV